MKNIATLLISVLCTLYSVLSHATSYTWTGTTSTAWSNSGNWSPAGIPSSGDNVTIVTTGNQPVIAANTSVTDFTMTSGTLSLATYTLNVSGTLTCNGGTINNGTVNATGTTSTFAGTVFGAKVTVNSSNVNLNGSKFNNNATFTKTGSGNNFGTGGNVFNDTLIANQDGSGYFVLGFSAPDTFNVAAYFNSSGNYLAVGYGGTNNYFAGDVYASCTGTEGILFNYSGTAQYMGNIYLACSDASGVISFGQSGGSATMAAGKTFIEAGAGFSAGFVDIYNFTKNGTTAINLDFGTNTGIGFKAGNTINGTITWVGGQAYLNGTVFNNDVSFTQILALDSYSSGGNTFNGDATFINSTANDIYLANTSGDDFNADVTFTESSTGKIYPGYNGSSTYAGDITGNSTDKIDFGAGSTLCRNILDGSGVQVMGGTAEQLRFKKLKVDKSGGYVSLDTIIAVYDSLVFDDGIIKCNAQYAVVHDNAKAVGANNDSYIEGRSVKIGDDAFTYPVGRNGHYSPVSMSAPLSTGDTFYAEYINKSSNDDYSHSSKDGSIAALSSGEYWILQRVAGSSTVNVTLSWDTTGPSCSFASTANLKVAAWDGSQWKDKGNGGTTGNLVAGTVVTSSASSIYGAYALSTSASFYCVPCYADAGEDQRILDGDEIQIGETAVSGLSYQWTPSTWLDDDNSAEPLANPYDHIVYKVTSTNSKGCVASDLVKINVLKRNCYLAEEEEEGIEKASVNAYCDELDAYIPGYLRDDLHNLLTIRLSIVIIQNSNGESNFTDDYATDLATFQNVINNDVNIRMRNIADPAPGWENTSPTVDVDDTKIEFVVDDLYYEQSDEYFFIEDEDDREEIIDLFAHKKLETVNFFIINDKGVDSQTCPAGGYRSCNGYGIGLSHWVGITTGEHFAGLFFLNSEGEIDAELLVHEIGHMLSLPHAFDGAFADMPTEYEACPCSNNYMGYAYGTRDYFSPMQIAKMRRNIENNLGTINTLLQCQIQSLTPLEITTDKTWDKAVVMDRDIVVKTGNTLTIQCKVSMPEDSKIIVEPGAKLVVDGGYITNSCFSVWKGVEVWGIPTNAQGTVNVGTPSSSSTTQGLIVMKNGAIIENARIGVNLMRDGYWTEYNGGIIKAENSTFRNNRKDVQFMIYPYPAGNYASISSFTNCTFLTDAPMNGTDYIVEGRNEGTNGHVTLWGVRGVSFTDCDFVCDIDDSWASDNAYHNWDDDDVYHEFDKDIRAAGITSIDALYFVNSTEPADEDTRSRFLNLTTGVWSLKSFSSQVRYTHITGALFDNCLQGVAFGGSTYDYVINSDFNIPEPDGENFDWKSWGVYTFGSKSFRIEENTFTNIAPSFAYNIGVINQGYKLNGICGGLVRYNTHNGTLIGNQMELNNPYLKVSCNSYTDHGGSWVVNPEIPGCFLGPQGTGCNADNDTRADNVFIDQADDIWSYAQYWRYWAADATNAVPDFATPAINGTVGINGIPCTEILSIDCVPGGGDMGDEKMIKAGLDIKYDDLLTEYGIVEASLDNGQKATMLTNIANSGYSNATLASDLIANSPLSDEVLIAACGRTSFTSQQKIDFIVPNCPVSAEVWPEVEGAFAGPVPGDITDAQRESTERTLTAIKRDGDAVMSNLHMTINNILHIYVDDNKIDSLIFYLKDTLDYYDEADRLLVGTLLQVDSIELARTVLEGMPQDNANEEAFYDFYDIAVTLAEEEKTWFELDGGQRTAIEALAISDYEIAINAQAVLSLVDDVMYPRTPEVLETFAEKWDGNPPASNQQPEPEETNSLKNIAVYPNPFSNSFTINYTLEQEAAAVRIEIMDLVGRTVTTKKIQKTERGLININLDECLGIYVLRIYADEKQVHNQKLICLQK